MGAKSLIPKSKAKTAYGLLSEVRKLILAEPLRYNQAIFNDTTWYDREQPSCGTTACVAGWVGHLKGFRGDSWSDVDYFACRVLGIEWTLAWGELFDPDLAGDYGDATAHAQRGAEMILEFQQKYAAQLKAKRV